MSTYEPRPNEVPARTGWEREHLDDPADDAGRHDELSTHELVLGMVLWIAAAVTVLWAITAWT